MFKHCSLQDGWELTGSLDAAFTFKTKTETKMKTYIFKVFIGPKYTGGPIYGSESF